VEYVVCCCGDWEDEMSELVPLPVRLRDRHDKLYGVDRCPSVITEAEDFIEQQAERIRELDTQIEGLLLFHKKLIHQRDELAAQNQAMRERMDRARSILTDGRPTPMCNWGLLSTEDLPSLATPILAELKAKTLEEAARRCAAYTDADAVAADLRRMAQELRGK